MRPRLVIAATALGLGATGAALADDNSSVIIQEGNTHQGLIIQTGTGNTAGSDALVMTQTGYNNYLKLTQSGDENTVGLSGRGLVQTGTFTNDSAIANSATILQNSTGNAIGELVQTTLGAFASVGNLLTVTQDIGDDNTITSIEQVVGAGAASNVAHVTQTGRHNWLAALSQLSSSAEGANTITFIATGDFNGVDPNTQSGPGDLAVLARSSGAHASQLIQGTDLSGGALNLMNVTITGSFNQYGLEQYGVDNSVGAVVTGLSNSFGSYQLGRHNQITTGGIAGDSNDMGLRQVGEDNVAAAVLQWSSSDNRIGIGQDGDANHGDISLKGNGSLIGLSQDGRGHVADVTVTGNDNVLFGIQANAGLTASLGNTLTVTITGSFNNALSGGLPQGFSGAALSVASAGPLIPGALLVAPDATALLGPHSGNLLLIPGTLLQWGEANSIDIDVGALSPSDGNFFAVAQKGDRNVLTASIEGSYNQLAVLQMGDDNIVATSQMGTGNVIGISQ